MKYVLSIILLVLLGGLASWAQPPMPDPILQTDWTSGSDNEDFNNADEQTSGPVVYDLTGDGQPEVIVTGRTNIWVFNVDHPNPADPVFPSWTPPDGFEFCSPVAIAHLSADGDPWVVVGASYAREYVYPNCPMRIDGLCGEWAGHDLPDPDCHGYDWNESGNCFHWESVIQGWKIEGETATEFVSDVRPTQRLTTAVVADADGDGLDELCFFASGSYGINSHHPGNLTYSTVGVHFYE